MYCKSAIAVAIDLILVEPGGKVDMERSEFMERSELSWQGGYGEVRRGGRGCVETS